MKPAHEQHSTAEHTRDLQIPGGCLLCGGDLAVRITEDGARSFCPSCRWLSKPHMERHGDAIHVTHPAAGLA